MMLMCMHKSQDAILVFYRLLSNVLLCSVHVTFFFLHLFYRIAASISYRFSSLLSTCLIAFKTVMHFVTWLLCFVIFFNLSESCMQCMSIPTTVPFQRGPQRCQLSFGAWSAAGRTASCCNATRILVYLLYSIEVFLLHSRKSLLYTILFTSWCFTYTL